jgi:hypothetical protein
MNNRNTNNNGHNSSLVNDKHDDDHGKRASTNGHRPSLYCAWQLAMMICSFSCVNEGELLTARDQAHNALALMFHPSITVMIITPHYALRRM